MKLMLAFLACCMMMGSANATVVFTSDDTYTVSPDGSVEK